MHEAQLTMVSTSRRNGNGLFMHFCGSNHELTQMQQEEK